MNAYFITLTNRHLIKKAWANEADAQGQTLSSELQINETIASLIFIKITSTVGNYDQSRTNLKAGSRITDIGSFRSMFVNENH